MTDDKENDVFTFTICITKAIMAVDRAIFEQVLTSEIAGLKKEIRAQNDKCSNKGT